MIELIIMAMEKLDLLMFLMIKMITLGMTLVKDILNGKPIMEILLELLNHLKIMH